MFCCKDLISANSEGYPHEESLGIRSSPSLRDNCPSGKIVFCSFFGSFILIILFLQVIRRSNIRSRKSTEEDDDSDEVEESDQENDEL